MKGPEAGSSGPFYIFAESTRLNLSMSVNMRGMLPGSKCRSLPFCSCRPCPFAGRDIRPHPDTVGDKRIAGSWGGKCETHGKPDPITLLIPTT